MHCVDVTVGDPRIWQGFPRGNTLPVPAAGGAARITTLMSAHRPTEALGSDGLGCLSLQLATFANPIAMHMTNRRLKEDKSHQKKKGGGAGGVVGLSSCGVMYVSYGRSESVGCKSALYYMFYGQQLPLSPDMYGISIPST